LQHSELNSHPSLFGCGIEERSATGVCCEGSGALSSARPSGSRFSHPGARGRPIAVGGSLASGDRISPVNAAIGLVQDAMN
jgi:hypothetical protein